MKRVYVWTLPTRLFHWLFVALILGAWISTNEDRWLSIHVALGSALAGLAHLSSDMGNNGTKIFPLQRF